MRSARVRNALLVVMALLATALNARASGPASTYAVLELPATGSHAAVVAELKALLKK